MKHAAIHPAVLVLTVLGAALLVWLLVQGDEEPAPYARDEVSRPEAYGGDRRAPEARTKREAGDEPTASSRRGIPRVLPPDAAIEDVRDALALGADERGAALRAASAAIGRLATQGREALGPLRSYAKTVEDPVLRGVVIASLGRERSDTNLRALADTLARSDADAERMGALIALAQPAAKSKAPRSAAHSDLLAGLPYDHVALPSGMTVLKAGARFLDEARDALSQDALPVLLRSIGAHAEWAALLVIDDARMCAWYASLRAEDRARVRAQALRHERLRGNARTVIRNAE